MTPAGGGRRLVPAHVVVDGRTSSTHPELCDITLLRAVRHDTSGQSPERARVVRLCSAGGVGVLALAEIAAHLALPRVLAEVLVGDLIDSGHLGIASEPPHIVTPRRGSPGPPFPDLPSHELLQRVLDGLQKL